MHRGHHFGGRPQAGNDDGNLMFHAQANILFQAIVAAVHDLIDGEGRHLAVRVGSLKAASSSVICASQSSSCDAGLAFSAGNEPTMPALHCARTNRGVDTMNIGAPMTGKRK